MLTQTLVIARKELIDAARDSRPLFSSLVYSLMGAGAVFMVSLSTNGKDRSVLIAMMSVFTLVSAFVGGMNVAMDILAGERERQSLLPLLMNAVARRDVLIGKWLAVSCFATAGLVVNLAAFAFVLTPAFVTLHLLLILVLGLIPLALLAAAIELGISTVCRTVKEAHTYLSMLVFLPMGLGMLGVFYPKAVGEWSHIVPLIGQQWLIGRWVRGGDIPILPSLLLGITTAALTTLALWGAAKLLDRDDVVYGN
jgi:sodium transport system permease protein